MIGRDSNLSFWLSNWTSKGPLCHLIHGPLTQEATQWEVKDMLANTSQDQDWIRFDLPLEIKLMIQATPISLTSRGNDRIAWIGNLRGIFDLKSAYSIAMGTDFTLPVNASWIWKSETLPRIKTLLWRCTHNNIGVKTCLAKRGIVDEDWCPIYQRDLETILHALRDCLRVKEVWIQSGVKVMN